MTTNLHDKMLAAIDALFSASDAVEEEVAENLLLDVRDEIRKQKDVPETNFGNMTPQTEAERLADCLETHHRLASPNEEAAAELRRLQHNNLVLMDALWKACGDDEEMVNGYIESQGELK